MMRRSWMAAIVVSLIVLNVWRWWPADATAKHSVGARHAPTSAQDLRLAVRAPTGAAMPRMERDIFQSRQSSSLPRAKPSQAPSPRRAPVVLPVAELPPPKTPEEIDAEAAQVELAQLKLVGVIVRDAKPRAYFARGDQTYMVSVGDTVARFTVTAITAENARLHDPRTRIDSVIPVLGR